MPHFYKYRQKYLRAVLTIGVVAVLCIIIWASVSFCTPAKKQGQEVSAVIKEGDSKSNGSSESIVLFVPKKQALQNSTVVRSDIEKNKCTCAENCVNKKDNKREEDGIEKNTETIEPTTSEQAPGEAKECNLDKVEESMDVNNSETKLNAKNKPVAKNTSITNSNHVNSNMKMIQLTEDEKKLKETRGSILNKAIDSRTVNYLETKLIRKGASNNGEKSFLKDAVCVENKNNSECLECNGLHRSVLDWLSTQVVWPELTNSDALCRQFAQNIKKLEWKNNNVNPNIIKTQQQISIIIKSPVDKKVIYTVELEQEKAYTIFRAGNISVEKREVYLIDGKKVMILPIQNLSTSSKNISIEHKKGMNNIQNSQKIECKVEIIQDLEVVHAKTARNENNIKTKIMSAQIQKSFTMIIKKRSLYHKDETVKLSWLFG
ncbi:hypothetical protein NEPAR04_2047 [Nematocida parisii]|nr:hypothetical protein NEPAR03_2124 [Nematocida parisii]KAI5130567.1 hypothetical protein NEPAR08_2094 [Nematocida parisii]KAI5144070.1 hypothetical protein NEPAR04_2047 [Nematocida parisii]